MQILICLTTNKNQTISIKASSLSALIKEKVIEELFLNKESLFSEISMMGVITIDDEELISLSREVSKNNNELLLLSKSQSDNIFSLPDRRRKKSSRY